MLSGRNCRASLFGVLATVTLLACGGRTEPTAPSPSADPVVVPASTIAAHAIRVHLSIDDAPWMIQRGHSVPLEPHVVGAQNEALIATLRERHVTTSVFFNCGRIQAGDGTVRAWLDAGHTVGNHTHTHAPLNELGPTEWLADAQRCHDQLRAEGGVTPRWMRYPFLGYGDGVEARDAATAGLAAMGERSAPVTVATTEWLHAYVYRKALRLDDEALKQQVVEDYHQHMDDALTAAVHAAASHPGRDVSQVVLVHLNELAVAELGVLIDRWQARGIEFVDLPTAMSDPLFSMANQYSGTGGLSWLWRIRTEEQGGRYWFGDEERRVMARFGGIDPLDAGTPQRR